METLFLYFGKVILTSGVMFLYYRLFLKDKTFHHYNRFYLLSVLVISLLLPLLKISYFTLEVNSDIYILINRLQNFNSTKTLDNDFFYFKLIAFVIGLVSLFFLTKLILGLIKIVRFKKQFSKENFEGINFYQTDLQNAPFSFFRNLFWKDSIYLNSDLGRQILKHEMVHIEQKHSWDKIFIQIITSLFWFNPVFYFIRKEINLIHEYLADKKAIKNSDTKAFAQMLLASHFSGKQFPATNPFFNSNLKKRLMMLKKPQTKFSYARRISALPILFILGFIYLVNAKNKEITKTNLEISKIITEIKKDTAVTKNNLPEENQPKQNSVSATENPPISTTSNVAFGKDGTEIYRKNPELFFSKDTINEDEFKKLQKIIGEKNNSVQPLKELLDSKNQEVRKIGDEMRKKGEEMRQLSQNKDFDNPKLKVLETDMDNLGKKMDEIYNSAEFKNMEKHYKEMDGLYAQMDKYYNSEAYKSKIREIEKRALEAEKRINSPEFQKRLKDAEKRALEAEKRINSPEFQKRIKDAENRAIEAEKRINSPEFQKRLKDSEAEILTNKDSKIIILNSSKNNTRFSTDENIKIYIDGKPVTKAEMDIFPSDKIEKMEVNKKGYNGKNTGEIYITTKKK